LIGASAAGAEDNLPPGVPVPAWAVGKYIHFYPAPDARQEIREAETSRAQPLVSGFVAPYCFNGDKLCLWGGPVQHEPQLFIIFWGEDFQIGPPATQELTALRDIYLGLEENKGQEGQKHWQYILSQYFDNEGPGAVTVKVKTIFDKPSNPGELTNEAVETAISELVTAEREKGVAPSAEAQYIVIPQPGTNYSKYKEMKGACGFHGVDNEGYSYSLIAWGEDTGCFGPGENETALDETEGTATHEFAESTTDPQVEEPGKNYTSRTGWDETEGGSNGEVADLCEGPKETEMPKNDHWFAAKLWDDKGGNKCAIEDPPYPAPVAPSATTGPAVNIEENTANLEGSVNPNGPDTHYYFEYGTTTSYGSNSPAPPGNNAGFGESTVPASTVLSGLTPNKLYHYRLVAHSWVGTTKGEDKTFRTRAWKIQSTKNPHGSEETDEFYGVSCWSATGCDAVGWNTTTTEGETIGLVERWNGSGWEVQSTPKSAGAKADRLESVACRSASECEATGYAEVAEGKHVTLAERWNGTAWSVQSTPTVSNNSDLVSVSCPSASECVADGIDISGATRSTLVELWNGKEWKIQTTAKLPKEDEEPWFESISCPSSKHCTAVGIVFDTKLEEGVPLVESWNGSTWTVQSTPVPETSLEAQLDGVSCSATSACTAVGEYYSSTEEAYRVLIERYNGTSWQLQESPSPVGKPAPKESHWSLDAVSCPTSGSCVAIGSYAESASARSLLLGEEWNGSRWELALPTDRTNAGVLYDQPHAVSCSAALTCTLAGVTWKEKNNTETLAERMEP
jgi:hypothetical protein